MKLSLSVLMLATLAIAIPASSDNLPKIAVVGLVHSHVWGHLREMTSGKSVQLVGLSEPNPALVAEAEKSGVPRSLFFPDYRKMLDEAKPDIVWAFVENNRHLEIAQACAPRHINVMFDKPLSSTYADALKIRDLAKQYGIRVLTNYQMAWWPANYTAKAAVDRGHIGTVFRLHGIVGHGGPGSEGPRNQYFFAWLTDPVQNGAGALMDFGCYNVLWSLWYLGLPESVYASANHLRPERFPKVEDNATIVLNYPKAVGIFEGSWDLPRSFQDLDVLGTAGSLHMNHAGVELTKGRSQTMQVSPVELNGDGADPLAYMASRIRSNGAVEGLTAIDINVEVIHLIELAKESIRTAKAIRVPAESTSFSSARK
jgi:predicted dehydrogenase